MPKKAEDKLVKIKRIKNTVKKEKAPKTTTKKAPKTVAKKTAKKETKKVSNPKAGAKKTQKATTAKKTTRTTKKAAAKKEESSGSGINVLAAGIGGAILGGLAVACGASLLSKKKTN